MSTKKIVLTDEGLKKLEEELEYLKTERRRDIADKIKVALSFGDLSENSEYDEAKNEQAMVEARITELEEKLKNVEIIDADDITTDKVNVGSVVKVYDGEYKEENTYTIVGSTEADPFNGFISDESPIGKALMGHKVGDTVEVEAPECIIKLEILSISK